jgi:hypothetical protein
MSEYLSEHEAEDAAGCFAQFDVPNLQTAAHVLLALIEWTNSNSDGWAYWMKPRKAASRLVDLVAAPRRGYLFGHQILDCTETELRDALRPIKSWDAELPWAAILPVHPTAVAEI